MQNLAYASFAKKKSSQKFLNLQYPFCKAHELYQLNFANIGFYLKQSDERHSQNTTESWP